MLDGWTGSIISTEFSWSFLHTFDVGVHLHIPYFLSRLEGQYLNRPHKARQIGAAPIAATDSRI